MEQHFEGNVWRETLKSSLILILLGEKYFPRNISTAGFHQNEPSPTQDQDQKHNYLFEMFP